jgi:type II secretory pathway pseudopilin PulG
MDKQTSKPIPTRIRSLQAGFLLVEIMVATGIISILALGVAYSMITSYKADLVSKRTYSALHLAHQKIEALALIDPQTLDNSDDSTELVTDQGITYLRTTDVTVAPSKARRVTVLVQTNQNSSRGGKAFLETSFSLWGRR